MKIYINKETYYSNPCPKITKDMWNWFYSYLWFVFSRYNVKNIMKIETIHIRINQAYKGCGNIHFYVTINKELKNKTEFHMQYSLFGDYHIQRPRYLWMIDFIECGGIDLGTLKPIERNKQRQIRIELKKKTSRNVRQLVSQYKTFLTLKEKFNYA